MFQPNCPNCSHDYTKRVSRLGFKERLLSIIFVYPFRCQLCGYRFVFKQWGVVYKPIEEDPREYSRMPMNFPASFVCDNVEGTGTVLDISINGCSLQGNTAMAQGSIICIALQFSEELAPVEVEAAVVHAVGTNRVGLEFLRFAPRDRERLQVFIRRFLNGNPEASSISATELGVLQDSRQTLT
jgi:DNA-directed RNA polymerase subunit RPC12/RpoP